MTHRWLGMTSSVSVDCQSSWRYVCQCVSWREDVGVNANEPSECVRYKKTMYRVGIASEVCRISKTRGGSFAASCASELGSGRT